MGSVWQKAYLGEEVAKMWVTVVAKEAALEEVKEEEEEEEAEAEKGEATSLRNSH